MSNDDDEDAGPPTDECEPVEDVEEDELEKVDEDDGTEVDVGKRARIEINSVLDEGGSGKRG